MVYVQQQMASSKTFIYKITEDIQYLRAKVGMTTCKSTYKYNGKQIELFHIK